MTISSMSNRVTLHCATSTVNLTCRCKMTNINTIEHYNEKRHANQKERWLLLEHWQSILIHLLRPLQRRTTVSLVALFNFMHLTHLIEIKIIRDRAFTPTLECAKRRHQSTNVGLHDFFCLRKQQ